MLPIPGNAIPKEDRDEEHMEQEDSGDEDMGDEVEDEVAEDDEDEVHVTAEQLTALHGKFDKSGDGMVSLEELLEFAFRPSESVDSDIQRLVEEMDTSKDGRVSLDEHLADLGDDLDVEESGRFPEAPRSRDDPQVPEEAKASAPQCADRDRSGTCR